MIRYLVYGLFDPTTGELRYIGKTKIGTEARLALHLQAARYTKRPYHSQRWILKLTRQGLQKLTFCRSVLLKKT